MTKEQKLNSEAEALSKRFFTLIGSSLRAVKFKPTFQVLIPAVYNKVEGAFSWLLAKEWSYNELDTLISNAERDGRRLEDVFELTRGKYPEAKKRDTNRNLIDSSTDTSHKALQVRTMPSIRLLPGGEVKKETPFSVTKVRETFTITDLVSYWEAVAGTSIDNPSGALFWLLDRYSLSDILRAIDLLELALEDDRDRKEIDPFCLKEHLKAVKEERQQIERFS